MPEFIKSIGRFFENHVEKIVLVIVGGLCAVLFFKFVIFSPNAVTVGNKRYAPSQIDRAISEQAKALQSSLGRDGGAVKGPKYTSVLTGRLDPNNPVVAGIVEKPLPQGFMGLFRSPLSFVTDQASIVPPARTVATTARRFKLPPRIGPVTEVAVNHIRAAAWVPTEALTPQRGYDKVDVEANDVDLVTVEAKFDTVELYRQFRAHFNGEEVARSEWRDPCLATPTFAAVELQRRALLGNDTWSDWQDVPRCQAETNGELFRITDRVTDLPPGGLDVRLIQFRRPGIVMDLLQPEPYQIASAEEDWFPPSFYDKYRSLQKKVDLETKREEREKARDQQQARDDGRYRDGGRMGGAAGGMGGTATGPGGRYRNTGPAGGVAGGMGGTATGPGGRYRNTGPAGGAGDMYGGGYGTDTTARSRRGAARTRGRGQDEAMLYDGGMYGGGVDPTMRKTSVNEVYRDFSQVLLNYRTKLDELEKPMLFWAFDDTARPGGTYQYRIRLGVFNPVAGTNQLVEQDTDKKDQVILWSDFSGVAGPVAIPERMYFFAKDAQVPKNSATVEVARYSLGYWRSESFEVKPGEAIGREMKPKKTEDRRRPGEMGGRITDADYAAYGGPLGMGGEMGDFYMPPTPEKASTAPEMIDYRTGKTLIDVVQVSDWGDAPNLRPRTYQEMLYTGDGQIIEHMPASMTYWPKDLVTHYQFVSAESKKEPQEFRAFKKGGFRSRGMQGMMDGYGYPGGMDGMDPYMMNPPGGLYP
jgi:hypothetical protein